MFRTHHRRCSVQRVGVIRVFRTLCPACISVYCGWAARCASIHPSGLLILSAFMMSQAVTHVSDFESNKPILLVMCCRRGVVSFSNKVGHA